jgi:hypothetical protein
MNKILIKNNILFLVVIFWFSINYTNASSCEYKSEINQCISANEKGTTKSIESFVCITWNNEEVAYQIVLDKEFKKLDKQMDKFITWLENNKNTYFWKWAWKNYIDWINDIHKKGDSFKAEYYKLCSDTIFTKVLACSDRQKTTVIEWLKYFLYNWSSCKKLVDTKIRIYKDVAFSVLMLDKQQINADDKKTYDQWERGNYDNLLDIMMINLWYIERIWQKWPSKLANPHK